MANRSKSRTSYEWMELITECRKSGMTDKRWCELNDINANSFYNAIKRLRKNACDIPLRNKSFALALAEPPERQDIVKIDILDDIATSAPSDTEKIAIPEPPHLDNHHTIEIELNGAHIRVTNDVNPALLSKAISSLGSIFC